MSEGEREGREEEEGEVHFEGGGGFEEKFGWPFFRHVVGGRSRKGKSQKEITRRAAMTHVVVSVRAIVCG